MITRRITRRLFLRSTAAGAVGAVAIPAAAAPTMTPREQASWHIQELYRLMIEDGGQRPTVIVQAAYGHRDYKTIGINIHGDLIVDTMFGGGAA